MLWSVTLLSLVASSLASIDMYSTYEAFTDDGRRCIGDCGKVWGQRKCVTTWHNGVAGCTNEQKTHTTRFVTLGGKTCISDCDSFNNYDKQWCAVSYNNWDYCSRPRAMLGYETVQSKNKYSTCLDDCTDRGSWYNWCHTGDGSWEKCDPTKVTVAYNNPTESGERCVTRCKKTEAGDEVSPAYCYTPSQKWAKCFLNPPPSVWAFGNISRLLNDECTFWTTSADGQRLERCVHNRRRRQLTTPANEFHFDCSVNVEDVLLMHQATTPIVELRPFYPSNPITDDTNPVLNYHTLETISSFADENESVDIPLNVEAVITSNTVGNGREPFNDEVNNNFYSMDVGLSDPHRNFDERGHMIAARLGGPTTFYNIFPQTRWSNRGRASPWYALETQIERFIRESPQVRYVRMWVGLSYPVDGLSVLVHRPNAIGVRVRAYDNRQMVDLFTGAPVDENTNAQENLFFTNDPNRRCRG